jgi:hypothetical protein
LPAELLALADVHGVTVTRVSIRNQRSRWGACSSRGSITLNWRLILVPPFVREYVMIHELMHRRELNHSQRFWRHVAAACPRYDEVVSLSDILAGVERFPATSLSAVEFDWEPMIAKIATNPPPHTRIRAPKISNTQTHAFEDFLAGAELGEGGVHGPGAEG